MSRKGNISFEELLKWTVGFLVIFVIISIIIGPDKLFAKTRDAVFSFGNGLIPEKKPPPTPTKERIHLELEKYFDNLVFKIKNSGSGETCLIGIDEIPKVKGFNIELSQNKIQIKKIDQRGLTPSEKVENIDGFKPCSVRGTKTVQFYRCFKYAQPSEYAPDWCKNAYEEDISIILNENSNIANFLFKFDNNHLCVVNLDRTDTSPGCTELKGLIDDACVNEITRVYSDCSNPSPPKKQFDKECDAIEYCYAKLQTKNPRPDLPCSAGRPVAFFYTYHDCIDGSKCIKEHTSKMPFDICNDKNYVINDRPTTPIYKYIWQWPKYP